MLFIDAGIRDFRVGAQRTILVLPRNLKILELQTDMTAAPMHKTLREPLNIFFAGHTKNGAYVNSFRQTTSIPIAIAFITNFSIRQGRVWLVQRWVYFKLL